MADDQLTYIAGLVKAHANAAAGATVINTTYIHRLVTAPPQGAHPVLELYRDSEEMVEVRGNKGQRVHKVLIRGAYYLGPKAQGALSTAVGALPQLVELIDNALEDAEYSGYQSGKDLDELADIEWVHLRRAQYTYAEGGSELAGDAYPALTLEIEMQHRHANEADPGDSLDLIVLTEHLDNVSAGTYGHDIITTNIVP